MLVVRSLAIGASAALHDETSGHPFSELVGRRSHGAAGDRRRAPRRAGRVDHDRGAGRRSRRCSVSFPRLTRRSSSPRRRAIRDLVNWRALGDELAGGRFDTALLLPNSMHAAVLASRAGIPERWGYRTGWRGRLADPRYRPPIRPASGSVLSTARQRARFSERSNRAAGPRTVRGARRGGAPLDGGRLGRTDAARRACAGRGVRRRQALAAGVFRRARRGARGRRRRLRDGRERRRRGDGAMSRDRQPRGLCDQTASRSDAAPCTISWAAPICPPWPAS